MTQRSEVLVLGAGVIGLSGIYEPWLFEHRVMRPIFGEAPDRQRTMAANNLRPGMPPALLLAGGWDWTVEPRNSTDLAAAMRGDLKKGLFFRGAGPLPFGDQIRSVRELIERLLTPGLPQPA